MIELPHVLVDQLRDGNAVLLLGAGASKGAIHPQHHSPPDGLQLSKQIAEKFLGPDFVTRSLDQVAALAISETDLTTVQEFIADIYRDFQPAPFHSMVPTFRWSAIATTNYDLIVERAYSVQSERLQELVPFTKNGEHVEKRLRTPDSVAYLKLHGCISKTSDQDIPLILTPEQYITHRLHRSRLFDRLLSLAHEKPLVVVGHSLNDIDIRAILLELSALNDSMPRSYLVAPHITAADSRYWEQKKFSVVRSTFEDFIQRAASLIPPASRKLSMLVDNTDHPICKRLQLGIGASLPTSIAEYLTTSADYVHSTIPVVPCIPKLFYKGHFEGWPEIQANLDVRRGVTDQILTDVVLPSEAQRTSLQELVVLRGHAGSGKRVTLYRLAWEAACEFEALCIFIRDSSALDYDILREIHRLAQQRIFLFIDSASKQREGILSAMRAAQRDGIPLTIVTAERYNEWSAYCDSLEPYVTKYYSIAYLSGTEISELIRLLSRHKSLGHLTTMSDEDRHQALAERAGRHLLVALHEATLGKAFSDIILDEYRSIPDPRARTLYRTICVLHRLGVTVRAGLIARVHGISMSNFRETLFRPLEEVVFARKPDGATDYSYRSRHPHIAEIVFERSLQDPSERLDEYLRVISCLDVDYDSDRAALRGLANARSLEQLFPETEMARRVFAAARARDDNNAALLQQEALLEMHAGFHEAAYDILQQARRLQPSNLAIQHTLAELSLARSEASTHRLEVLKYREEARSLARDIVSRGTRDSHAYHTLLKIALSELNEVMADPNDATFATSLREFERLLTQAKQKHPNDSHILDVEAKCAHLVNDDPQALSSLKRAFLVNKGSAYIASRLAQTMKAAGDIESATAVLKEALDHSPGEKELHLRLAMMTDESIEGNRPAILHHLQHSFTRGDNRYDAQFWCARAHFLYGDIDEADALFRALANVDVDRREKLQPKGSVSFQRFHGTVDVKEEHHAFVRRDSDRASVFLRRQDCTVDWERIRRGTRVRFALRFNFLGAVGVKLEIE